jgi:hypothetical protein
MIKILRILRIYVWGILLLLQLACNQQTNRIIKDSSAAIQIDLDRDDQISFNDVFEKIDIIPLETNEQSVFNDPFSKFFVSKDRHYYILDNQSNSIFVFDEDGLFKKTINKHGQGTEEYLDITDFSFNRFNNDLEILSAWGTLLVYDSTGEVYIKKFKTGEVIHDFNNLTEDIDVFFTGTRENNKMFFFSRSQQKVIDECFSRPDFVYTETVFKHTNSPFYIYNDTVCFYDGANGDIFTINPKNRELKPRYQWDFGIHNFDISLLPNDKDKRYYMEFSNYGNNQYAFAFLLNAENDEYVITRFRFKRKHKTIIYNKRSKEYRIFHKFKEDFQCCPIFMNNEYMYSIFTPDYLSIIINEKGLNEKGREILNNIKPDDNSVVVRYKFKRND